MNAREMIKKAYGASKNMMTSSVISYGKIGKNMAYELSWGWGILDRGKKIYGVTVAAVSKHGKGIKKESLSTCFRSKADAMKHIEKLKKKYGGK